MAKKKAKTKKRATKKAAKPTVKRNTKVTELTWKDDERYFVAEYDNRIFMGKTELQNSEGDTNFNNELEDPIFNFNYTYGDKDNCVVEVDDNEGNGFDQFDNFKFLTKKEHDSLLKSIPTNFDFGNDNWDVLLNSAKEISFGCGAIEVDEKQLDNFIKYLKIMKATKQLVDQDILDNIIDNSYDINSVDDIIEKMDIKEVEKLKTLFTFNPFSKN